MNRDLWLVCSLSLSQKPLLLGSHSTNLTFNDIQDWCQLPSEEVIMSKKWTQKKSLKEWKIILFLMVAQKLSQVKLMSY